MQKSIKNLIKFQKYFNLYRLITCPIQYPPKQWILHRPQMIVQFAIFRCPQSHWSAHDSAKVLLFAIFVPKLNFNSSILIHFLPLWWVLFCKQFLWHLHSFWNYYCFGMLAQKVTSKIGHFPMNESKNWLKFIPFLD